MDETTSGDQSPASDFDAYLQQVEERKARFREQIAQGRPDVAGGVVVLTHAEAKALASGEQAGD